MSARLAVQAGSVEAARSRQLLVPIVSEFHPEYGRIDVSAQKIARFADNFRRGVKTYHGKLPFTVVHDDNRAAAGWITNVWQEADGLWGDVEWTPTGVEAIEDQEFPFISPEWRDRWTDGRSGQTYSDVFEGASLVVRPQFRDLPPAVVQQYTEDPTPTVMVIDGADEQVTPQEDDMADEDLKQVGTNAAADKGEEGAAASDPPKPEDEGVETVLEVAVGADGSRQTFAEAYPHEARELAELRRETAVKRFSEQLAPVDLGQSGYRLTPAARGEAAELAADIHQRDPALAKRFAEWIGNARLFPQGELGTGAGAAETKKQFSEADAAIMAQLGLSEEDY